MSNDLVRNLILAKDEAVILGLHLKQCNLLEKTLKFPSFDFVMKSYHFVDVKDNLCYCKDVSGLMIELGYEHDSDNGGYSSTPAKPVKKLFCCIIKMLNHLYL